MKEWYSLTFMSHSVGFGSVQAALLYSLPVSLCSPFPVPLLTFSTNFSHLLPPRELALLLSEFKFTISSSANGLKG